MNGALLINKNEDISSFGVIRAIKKHIKQTLGLKKYKELPKIGHAGTLDPFATGLLVILIGKATRLSQYFLESNKSYNGIIRFGESSISGDLTSPISTISKLLPTSIDQIKTCAESFLNTPYLQTPPMHSAIKVDGIPLYKLARKGKEIKREPKQKKIYDFKINNFNSPNAYFEVICSSGTYVRTLAQDLAKKMDTVSVLTSLTRTQSGAFSLNNALTIDELKTTFSNITQLETLKCWIPFDQLLSSYETLEITKEQAKELSFGRQKTILNLIESKKNTVIIGIYFNSQLVATAKSGEITHVFISPQKEQF